MENNEFAEWILSDIPLTMEMFDDFKILTRELTPNDQLLFIRKVINEVAQNNIALTIADLLEIKSYSLDTIKDFKEPRDYNYTLDLILHTIKIISLKTKFPKDTKEVYLFVKEIADIICDYVQNNIENLTRINLLFDHCPGRTAIVKKTPDEEFINLRGNDYKVYDIYQGYSIINRDRDGLGELVLHYEKGIYAKGEICMIEIKHKNIDNNNGNYDIIYGNNIEYNEKLYPFQWKKDENNYLITPDIAPVESCEGRKSPVLCNLSGKEFWWCYGRRCYKANQSTEWKNYSLKDILKILHLPFEEEGYYTFVSEINRINRLLDRIKCSDCKHILRPFKQSNFGFYRVSNFHCNNDKHNGTNCPSFHKEIYLTHCLNSKCTNVIDNRVAKRCPNGFIICDVCGGCCSNDLFKRIIQTKNTNGQSVSKKLIDMLNNKVGHWEKHTCFCYKCQNMMIKDKSGNYICKECNVQYDNYCLYIRFYKRNII